MPERDRRQLRPTLMTNQARHEHDDLPPRESAPIPSNDGRHADHPHIKHTSHTMTAVYARLADTTIREQWERARKINIRGEPVDTTSDGPLADAEWVKQNLARAKMALPNGYCGLPLQKSC